MRRGSILVEGSMDGFQALGAFGQPVHQSYVQLRAAIEQKLGPRHADFFARPQIDDRAKRIRWVAPVPGEAVGWRDLSREEQAERALDLQIMRSDFDRYLKELAQEPARPADRRGGKAFAAILSQALKTPNDGYLYVIGDQPVATFWGFTEHGSPGFEPLSAAPRADAPAARPVAEAVVTPEIAGATVESSPASERGRDRGRWWPLALAGLLLLVLLWLFLWPIGSQFELQAWLPGAPDTVEEVPAEPPLVERDEVVPGQEVIEGEGGVAVEGVVVPGTGSAVAPGATVEESVTPGTAGPPGTGAGDDEPPPEPPPPEVGQEEGQADTTPPPVPPVGDEAGDGADPPTPADETAQSRPPVPKTAAQSPPGALPPAGVPLAIPDSAAGGSGPADFLAGRWRSRSGLVDEATGGELNQAYEFDQSGRGRSVVRRADGVECSAPAEARMENGQLRVRELEDLRCPDGQSFEKSETACTRDAGGQTSCRGAYVSGRSFDVQVDRAPPP
jgi:hypothetical protein